jgi:hypothetical protein
MQNVFSYLFSSTPNGQEKNPYILNTGASRKIDHLVEKSG